MLPLVKGGVSKTDRSNIFATLNKKGDLGLEMRSVITAEHTYVYNFWADGVNQYYDGAEWGGMARQGMGLAAEEDEVARKRLEFFYTRTREELYHNVSDENALRNLRDDPAHAETVEHYQNLMRQSLAENDDPFQADYDRFLESIR